MEISFDRLRLKPFSRVREMGGDEGTLLIAADEASNQLALTPALSRKRERGFGGPAGVFLR
jgi:hypothetical protein